MDETRDTNRKHNRRRNRRRRRRRRTSATVSSGEKARTAAPREEMVTAMLSQWMKVRSLAKNSFGSTFWAETCPTISGACAQAKQPPHTRSKQPGVSSS